MSQQNVSPQRDLANPAESLLQLELDVRGLLSRGVPLPRALDRLGVTFGEYRTALALRRASDRHKLRSMAEDWSYGTIQTSLGLAAQPSVAAVAPRPKPKPGKGPQSAPSWVPLVAALAFGFVFSV